MNQLLSISLLALSLPISASAHTTLVKNGKPAGRIVVNDTSQVNKQAASLLQDFVSRISGANLPIVADAKTRKGDVRIGEGSIDGLTEDGFRVASANGVLKISSGGDKGAIYGVVDLLEHQLGVNYFGENEYTLTPSANVEIDDVTYASNPAFRYRQSQNYALATDPIYRLWMRLEEPGDEFVNGMWVHTFNRLLPSDKYGKSHPEYYSLINGERRPGAASQWCLSNPEVFEVVAARIDSIFKANPDRHMISVSQNDGNFTNCGCPECTKVDQEEGSLSGNFIRFLNKLAARFPDKQFSTLAYLFTMQPPKVTKPLPNVNIMLCDIDCKREVPLTDNASGRDFMKALKGWSEISDNIFVWDYGINFDNAVAPFPNFPILQKNIQTFRDHNVKMHFSQIFSPRGGDFAEMRTWMVSKLMWNPDADSDSLMQTFMHGYYGAAAPYLYEYEKLLEGGLLASDADLWIYDSPVTHKDGMLNEKCRKRYNELFDKAEAAVADEPELLKRVRRSRLPLQYSELEIARATGKTDEPWVAPAVNLFEQRTAEYGVPTLNERNNSPAEYCRLYRERYLAGNTSNKARGAKVTYVNDPSGRYAKMHDALTDGIYGGTSYVESWVGWEGTDGSFVIDLGTEQEVSKISTDYLHALGAWILLPAGVNYSTSLDGESFKPFGSVDQPEDRDSKVKFVRLTSTSSTPVKARYIRADVRGTINCPGWHYGVGHPSWFFVDEIEVE